MKLNEKIIKLRKEQGLSQEEFGNKINVSRQAVSKWESEQTKPDIDKIKEIAKLFNVTYDYLLNDEIDEVINVSKESEENQNKKVKKKNKHIILKIFIVIFCIYLLISIYKFIALYKFYKIADSFSEENYYMSTIYYDKNDEPVLNHYVKKVGNRKIEAGISPFDDENAVRDEDGNVLPHHISFWDYDKKIHYELMYDNENKEYIYIDRSTTDSDKEELENNLYKNIIKEETFAYIPSNIKNILLASINPFYHVSMKDRLIYVNVFNKIKIRVTLNNDYLLQSYDMQTEFDGNIGLSVSYDYVQDHFKEIQNPLEIYNVNMES